MPNIFARQRQLIGTTAEWATDNLVVGDGEIAVERTATGVIRTKVGNGVSTFSALPYVGTTFGAGYTWRNVTSTYTLNADHTSPDHPIMISVRGDFVTTNANCAIVCAGLQIAVIANGGVGAMTASMSAIIPPGSTYRVNQTSMSVVTVMELRAD